MTAWPADGSDAGSAGGSGTGAGGAPGGRAGPGAGRDRGEPGGLADEAARLFEALSQAASSWSTSHGFAKDEEDAAAPSGSARPTACRVCPLCRLLDHLQAGRPDAVRHLADALASFSSALVELVPPAPAPPRGAGAGTGDEDRGHTRVQHIDVTD